MICRYEYIWKSIYCYLLILTTYAPVIIHRTIKTPGCNVNVAILTEAKVDAKGLRPT